MNDSAVIDWACFSYLTAERSELYRAVIDGPAGLAEACEVLTTSSATWSADEREQIKRFLQQAIGTQRDSGLTQSWHEAWQELTRRIRHDPL